MDLVEIQYNEALRDVAFYERAEEEARLRKHEALARLAEFEASESRIAEAS